jgi:hypothetical protein
MKRFGITFAVIISALLLGGFTGVKAGSVQLSRGEVKELAATAATPADHLKLAAYFNGEAGRFEAEAIEHQNLANAHRARTDALAVKHTMSGNTAGHCDYFATVAREKARANRELATEHERMATRTER